MAPPESEVGFFTYTAQAPETRIFSRYNAASREAQGVFAFCLGAPSRRRRAFPLGCYPTATTYKTT